MKNEPLPPEPVAADGSGVRDVLSERAVAKLAQRAARTSGWGLAFVALVVALVAMSFITQPHAYAFLALLLFLLLAAIVLLGLGWILGLVAWRQQRRLRVSSMPGVRFSLLVPLFVVALPIAVVGFVIGVFVLISR